jgi:actin-related protein 4
LTPHYLIQSKTPVDAGVSASATYRSFVKPPHESFRKFQEERVLLEFKESVVQVWPGPNRLGHSTQGQSNEEIAKNMPGRPFEMPDGWNQVFTGERFRVAEGLFDAKMALFVSIYLLGIGTTGSWS